MVDPLVEEEVEDARTHAPAVTVWVVALHAVHVPTAAAQVAQFVSVQAVHAVIAGWTPVGMYPSAHAQILVAVTTTKLAGVAPQVKQASAALQVAHPGLHGLNS